jgi:hypothetical protein
MGRPQYVGCQLAAALGDFRPARDGGGDVLMKLLHCELLPSEFERCLPVAPMVAK